uniref:Nuclear nucleic acid-binding protein C1D n=1 Tax=Canis lupus familiaris TaxID=9615 RepID=A0A8C0RZ49_CANLF
HLLTLVTPADPGAEAEPRQAGREARTAGGCRRAALPAAAPLRVSKPEFSRRDTVRKDRGRLPRSASSRGPRLAARPERESARSREPSRPRKAGCGPRRPGPDAVQAEAAGANRARTGPGGSRGFLLPGPAPAPADPADPAAPAAPARRPQGRPGAGAGRGGASRLTSPRGAARPAPAARAAGASLTSPPPDCSSRRPAPEARELDPLEQAKVDLVSAYTLNSMFWVYLATQGVNPKEHPVKQELERIRVYMNRVKEITDKKKAGKLDKGAASRFVKNALWEPKPKNSSKVANKGKSKN